MNVFKTSNFLLPLLPSKRAYTITSCTKLIEEPILLSSRFYTIKEVLFARKLKEILKNSSIVAFYHFHESATDGWTHFRQEMSFKEGINLTVFPNLICQAYLSRTKYKKLLPFFVGKTITAYTAGPVQNLIKMLGKQSQLILLGALYKNELLSANQLKALGRLPEKENLQGEVISILNMNGEQLRSMLEQNQRNLTSYLEQIGDKKRDLSIM